MYQSLGWVFDFQNYKESNIFLFADKETEGEKVNFWNTTPLSTAD